MEKLCMELLWAKSQEAHFRGKRLEIEQKIVDAVGLTKPEGTTSRIAGSYKVVVTTKLSRDLDYDKYEALGLPETLQFVDLKPIINMARLRHIEAVDPALVASCITTKPAKTAVKIEEVAA